MNARPRFLLSVLTMGLLVTSLGCARKGGEQTAAEKPAKSEAAKSTTASKVEARPKATETVASTDHVRLIDNKCVQFEPHWTSISIGHSLTWTSELKAPVTIHVAAGAFDRTEFVVRPGASFTTGPALKAGMFTMWSEPAACQEISRGAQGTGPGVTIKE